MSMEPHAKPASMEPRACECGKEPFVDYWRSFGGHNETFVRCQHCGLIGPVGETEEEAINLWNRKDKEVKKTKKPVKPPRKC